MRFGPTSVFTVDLTDEQRHVCSWVALQARNGVRRIRYDEARLMLGVGGEVELTRILRQIRERLDEIHDMIESPIVNTAAPYFDINGNADHIWDDYCRAEEETLYTECGAPAVRDAMLTC